MKLQPASTFAISRDFLTSVVACIVTTLIALLGGLALMPAHAPENPAAVFVLILLFVYLNVLLFWDTLRADLRPISILLWIYLAYFMILPAIAQVWNNDYPWDTRLHYDESTILISSLLVFCFCVSYTIGEFFARRNPRGEEPGSTWSLPRPAQAQASVENVTIVLICAVAISVSIYAIAGFGLNYFLLSRYEAGMLGDANPGGHVTSLADILPVIGEALVFAAFMLVAYMYLRARRMNDDRQRVLVYALALVIVPLQIVMNSPLRVARFWLFGMLIAFLLAFFPPKTRAQRFWSVIGFIAATFVLLPLANLTRAQDYGSFEMPSVTEFLLAPDLDGFQSLMSLVSYTQDVGFTYGKQLLTVLLFFIPRAIWTGKGEDTGSMIADYAGYVINNISSPIVGELYIDFSIVGLVAGAIAIGFFTARAETHYSRSVRTNNVSIARLLVASISGFTIILARGTLGGIIAPVISGVAPFAAVLIAGRVFAHRRQIGSTAQVNDQL